jgi:hypothetical protein
MQDKFRRPLAALLKSGIVRAMPKKKEPELDPKEQFKRFVETAHEHGVDESGKEFEKAFKKVVPPKRGGKRQVK